MRFNIIFIIFFFIFAAQARVYRYSSMFQDVHWKMSVTNHNYFDASGNRILLASKLYGLLNHSFLPTVDFSTEYVLDTREGAIQSDRVRRKSKNQIHPNHMYLSVQPMESEPLFVRTGMINQEVLNAPLLISDWTFLGFQAEYLLHNEKLFQYVDNFKIVLQYTIPSSDTGLDYLQQIQDIAVFYTASLFTSSFIRNQIKTDGSLTAFYYKDLSAEAANYGVKYGNEVRFSSSLSAADPEFPYPFVGLYARGKARYNLFPELGLEIDTSLLWNIGAIDGANDRIKNGEQNIKASAIGYNVWMGFHIPIAKKVIMVLNLEYFDNGRNASPAYYNSDRYVGSGKKGVILGLKSVFEEYNVFFDLQYATIRAYPEIKGKIGNPNYLKLEIGTGYEKI